MAFCCLLAGGSALDWGAVYLKGVLGANEGIAALGPAAFAAAMTIGRLFDDRLIERLRPATLVGCAALLGASGLGLAVAFARPWTGLAEFGLLGAGLSVVFPVLLSAAGGAARGNQSIAAVATVGYLGLLAGPAMIGALAEVVGLRYAFLAMVLLVGAVPVLANRVMLAGPSGESER